MAEAAPVIYAVTAVASLALTGYSIYQQNEAAKEAEKIAEANAAREVAEAEEIAQRAEEIAARESSLIKAIHGASGATGVSQENYLADFENQKNREIQWIRKSGSSRAAISIMQGKAARRTGLAQMVQTASQGMGQSSQWYMSWAQS